MLNYLLTAVCTGDALNRAFEVLANVASRMIEEDEEEASSVGSFKKPLRLRAALLHANGRAGGAQ
jgi:hypothetical protein